MKQNRSILYALILLVIASLACSLSTGGDGDAKKPEAPLEQDAGASEDETEASAPQYEAGYEPGWRIFSNANFVNGVAVHDGVLWAATEGGVVAWDLETDQAVKYTPLDGMGHLSTYDVVICPMPNPTVVVATETGLSLFDIASGTWSAAPITPENSNVSTSKITELFCDQENGRLLISYYGLGVLDIASGGWQRYLGEDGLAWDAVDGMTVSGKDIWTASYKGISVIGSQSIQVYDESTGMPDETTNAITSTSDGTVWVASSDGLLRFQQGEMSVFDSDNIDGLPAGRLQAITIASNGTVWVASTGNRLCQFDPAQENCSYTYEGDQNYYLTDMASGGTGDVYYSSYGGGIWAYNGSEWRNLLLQEDQLVGNFVEAFAEDPNGMMWVATDNGIQQFDPKNIDAPWKAFKAGEGGPPSKWAQGVFISPSGEIWLAHDSKRASSFDGSNWSRYGEEEGIISSVNAIAFDKNGTPYIGTNEGLLIMEGASHTLLTDTDGLPSKNVRSLYADGDVMWVGTVDGLARLQNGNVETVLDSSSNGMPDDNITAIRKTADGSFVIGTAGGLVGYDGQQVSVLLEPLSTSSMLGLVQAVSDIAIAPDGRLWVSTYAGLYHGDGQNWEHITTAEGLPANNVNTVFVDSSGVVWVGGGFTRSGGGIARFIPGETMGNAPSSDGTSGEATTGADPAESGSDDSNGSVKYDENTGLPLYPDAEQLYSTESVVNYWSNTDFATLRDFYLTEMPKVGWLLDLDENGNCRDGNRCMGWHGGYDDPENQTFFFLKGEKGYITMNLIPEGNQVNILLGVNEPAE